MVRVWLLRPMPHFNNQMKYFLEHNIIAVGYPVGQRLDQYSYEQIRDILKANDMEPGIGNVYRLVHEMQPGHLVVVPDENLRDVYFAKITSPYVYDRNVDEADKDKGLGFPHQREVEWYFDKKPLQRNELPDALLKSLRFPGAVAELTKHFHLIVDLVKDPDLADDAVDTDPTLDRLHEKALRVLEQALDGDDIQAAIRAAEVILQHSRD